MQTVKMIYDCHGQHYTVTLSPLPDGRFQVTIADRSYTIQAQRGQDGRWFVQSESRQFVGFCAVQGDQRFIHTGGETTVLSIPRARADRRRSAFRAEDFTAPMPGQVTEVLSAAGETVKAGQALVILEAMKMETRITAPCDGTVARVLVAKGQIVERGQQLIEWVQDRIS